MLHVDNYFFVKFVFFKDRLCLDLGYEIFNLYGYVIPFLVTCSGSPSGPVGHLRYCLLLFPAYLLILFAKLSSMDDFSHPRTRVNGSMLAGHRGRNVCLLGTVQNVTIICTRWLLPSGFAVYGSTCSIIAHRPHWSRLTLWRPKF